MRATYDTNIVVSGTLWGGPPAEALRAVREKRVTLLSSEILIAEYADVLSRSKFSAQIEKAGVTSDFLVSDYRALVEIVETAHIGSIIIVDPKDNHVLACAVGERRNILSQVTNT